MDGKSRYFIIEIFFFFANTCLYVPILVEIWQNNNRHFNIKILEHFNIWPLRLSIMETVFSVRLEVRLKKQLSIQHNQL